MAGIKRRGVIQKAHDAGYIVGNTVTKAIMTPYWIMLGIAEAVKSKPKK